MRTPTQRAATTGGAVTVHFGHEPYVEGERVPYLPPETLSFDGQLTRADPRGFVEKMGWAFTRRIVGAEALKKSIVSQFFTDKS